MTPEDRYYTSSDEGMIRHLREQLQIAETALEYLSHAAETGKTARHMSTMAEDALIQMSVVD